jgi:hypothetical protein
MFEKSESRVAGLIVLETRPSRAGNAQAPERNPDGTLAEFLAYLTGSDLALAQCRDEPAPGVRPIRTARRGMCLSGRSQAARMRPTRLAANLPNLAAELLTALRQTRRRISTASRLMA